MKLFALVFSLCVSAVAAHAAPTRVTWYGHAAVEIVTPAGKVMMIDPWLRNPMAPRKDLVESIKKLDYVLVTHGHFDHVGDAVELGRKTGARLVASFELAQVIARVGGYPEKQIGFDTLGNAGGELQLDNGNITVVFVPAVHSSGYDTPGDAAKTNPFLYAGNPVGYVIKIKDGPTIYHSGDTAYFRDMELIGETSPPDLALLNIGGHFGMEPAAAASAARAVRARLVVPHHYKTFPVLTQDARGFFEALDRGRIAHRELKPGETLVFEGRDVKAEPQKPAKAK